MVVTLTINLWWVIDGLLAFLVSFYLFVCIMGIRITLYNCEENIRLWRDDGRRYTFRIHIMRHTHGWRRIVFFPAYTVEYAIAVRHDRKFQQRQGA